jgi:hypothetical protein
MPCNATYIASGSPRNWNEYGSFNGLLPVVKEFIRGTQGQTTRGRIPASTLLEWSSMVYIAVK